MEPDVFNCIDCNIHVYAWGRPKNIVRCAVCQWIHDQPNLTQDEIDEIRVMTGTPILEKDDG
jgi:hypothetical protein